MLTKYVKPDKNLFAAYAALKYIYIYIYIYYIYINKL